MGVIIRASILRYGMIMVKRPERKAASGEAPRFLARENIRRELNREEMIEPPLRARGEVPPRSEKKAVIHETMGG